MEVANTLAYCEMTTITAGKKVLVQAPEVNERYNTLLAVIYDTIGVHPSDYGLSYINDE